MGETQKEAKVNKSALDELLCDMPIDLDSAINKAAEHLPRGYKVNIQVEHAGYNVELIKPDGSSIDSVDGGDGIRSDINEAICIAHGFVP